MTEEHNKEFFNKMAEKWDEITKHNPVKIKYLIDKLDLKPGEKILDVGTGTGILLPHLYEKVGPDGRIFAIDLAEKMLEQAKLKYPYPNINYIVGDVTEAQLPAAFFNKIVCYSVFPHFVDPFRTLTALRGYLKAGGILLICHSESKEVINKRHDDLGRSLISRKLPPARDLEKLLISAEFEVLEMEDSEKLYFVKSTRK